MVGDLPHQVWGYSRNTARRAGAFGGRITSLGAGRGDVNTPPMAADSDASWAIGALSGGAPDQWAIEASSMAEQQTMFRPLVLAR